MSVDEKIAHRFRSLVFDVALQTAVEAHRYLNNHPALYGHTQYPELHTIFPKNNPNYSHFYNEIPYLMYDIPKYYLTQNPEGFTDYSRIFYDFYNLIVNHSEADCVDCQLLDKFAALLDFVQSDIQLKKRVLRTANEENLKYQLKKIVTDIVERYMFVTKASGDVPIDLESQLQPFVIERINCIIAERLPIDIYVPVCLVVFEDDQIQLSDNIEIVKISEAVQKSRQKACPYESNTEDWVAACATHMIVIHNYYFENSDDFSLNSSTSNYHSYPLQEIDYIFAAIRLVTGYTTGYEQILSSPLRWIDGFCADLVPLYGAKAHFVNYKETDKHWMNLSISQVNKEQAFTIKTIYAEILSCRDDTKKNNFIFALKRFNRCMLRTDSDDMATDATIGLEALLSGGSKSEISYTVSNRIPVVFAHQKCDRYTTTNSRSIMKKIYNYRSKIVHGSTMKERDMSYTFGETVMDIPEIAVDFLRYTLLFMAEHQDFLIASNFDAYIDRIMDNTSSPRLVQRETQYSS